MKIIEGTPEEINEYLSKTKKPAEISPAKTSNFYSYGDRSNLHWSRTKQQWINISIMDSVYITNVIRKMLRENTVADLLENEEFKSLIINLGKKLEK